MMKAKATSSGKPYPKEVLCRRPIRTFSGRRLDQVAFPLGGIGTGTISLSGRGELRDWEIFNRPNKGGQLPYTFAAIQVRSGSNAARVLESRPFPPYTGAHGYKRTAAQGLPRFPDMKFRGEYPYAFLEFVDDDLPVKVSLEAFNPFIPMDERDSGLPVAIFRYRVRNASKKKVGVTVCVSICNAIGHDGKSQVERRWIGFGKNLNRLIREDRMRGLMMTSSKYPEGHPRAGSMALATDWDDITYTTGWRTDGWWDDIQRFWDDFSSDGKLSGAERTSPTPDGETDIASLGLMAEIGPGQEVVLPFVLAWHFPVRLNEWNEEEPFKDKPIRNWYATQFEDAWDAARYALCNLKRLDEETQLFHDALFSSTLPGAVLDAASSGASIMRTNTCFRDDNGDLYGFEGCSPSIGCCPMNCTHVWNYEQAVAHLFPGLERTMRRTDFLVNTEPDGKMAFRTRVPISIYVPWGFHPAADGQMGCIMKLYREWLLSGDRHFLQELWPNAKRALEYAWKAWDEDRDGVMEGMQHNTYDIEFYGPNTMTGTLYLGALLAAQKMAEYLGDEESARRYGEVYARGRENADKALWNGEYYVQRCTDEKAKYQYGTGCLSDQLLGQWFAMVVDLGHLLPRGHVRKALASIFAYNWRRDMFDHNNCQRIYAINDEGGLLLCTWPRGGRPELPLVYGDEVWTGIEYQVAAHMIYEGMIDEALTIVKAARDRYDGARRNPWNEVECGDHYARAMSSWSLLLALSGFRYSAPERSIGFAPRVSPENFRCFFSAGSCWGTFSQKTSPGKQEYKIEVLYGEIELSSLTVSLPIGKVPRKSVNIAISGGGKMETVLTPKGRTIRIDIGKPVRLRRGETMAFTIGLRR